MGREGLVANHLIATAQPVQRCRRDEMMKTEDGSYLEDEAGIQLLQRPVVHHVMFIGHTVRCCGPDSHDSFASDGEAGGELLPQEALQVPGERIVCDKAHNQVSQETLCTLRFKARGEADVPGGERSLENPYFGALRQPGELRCRWWGRWADLAPCSAARCRTSDQARL